MLALSLLLTVAHAKRPKPERARVPAEPTPAIVEYAAPEAAFEAPCGWNAGETFTYRMESVEGRVVTGKPPETMRLSYEQTFRVVDLTAERLRLEAPAAAVYTLTMEGNPMKRVMVEAVLTAMGEVDAVMIIDVAFGTSIVTLVNVDDFVPAMERGRAAILDGLRSQAANVPPEAMQQILQSVPDARAMAAGGATAVQLPLMMLCAVPPPSTPYETMETTPFGISMPSAGTVSARVAPNGAFEIVDANELVLDAVQIVEAMAAKMGLPMEQLRANMPADMMMKLTRGTTWQLDATDGWPRKVEAMKTGVMGPHLSIDERQTWTRL